RPAPVPAARRIRTRPPPAPAARPPPPGADWDCGCTAASAPTTPAAVPGDQRSGMAVAQPVRVLEQRDLLHVLEIPGLLEQPEPVCGRLAVGLLDGGKVRSGTCDFRGCAHGRLLGVDVIGTTNMTHADRHAARRDGSG